MNNIKSMIHNVTVHTSTDAWIPVQVQYFKEHIQSPFKIWGFVDDAPMKFAKPVFHFCQKANENHKNGQIQHTNKLDKLAHKVTKDPETHEDDILIFWDGDSFPVANIDDWLPALIDEFGLVAVQRTENGGDQNPHPLFTACRVKFWKDIKGSWQPDYFPTGQQGKNGGEVRWDTGGHLYQRLAEEGVTWYPIHRSQSLTEHPLFFGIYGGCIYHHGAAHRLVRNPKAKSRIDHQNGFDPAENKRVGDELFEKIKTDGEFWREFV